MGEEKELLAAASNFDLDALAGIYDTWSPGIYRFAMRFLGDQQLAEECVADTFSRFLRALKRGGGPKETLNAYLYRIARNWINDYYRRPFHEDDPLDEQLHDPRESPADQAGAQIEWSQVKAAMAHLTPDQRQVVMLKYLDGWENEQIAQKMSKPVTAIKSLQHRALAALQRMLKPEKDW
jgi:RNA polymerase sigma-70 factor (ECF subfamily)